MSGRRDRRHAHQHRPGGLHRRCRDGRRRDLLAARRCRRGRRSGRLAVVPHCRRPSPPCRATRSASSGRATRRPAACSSTSTAGFGDGHIATIVAWLVYIANGIVTAMVALSFGSYASSAFAGGDPVAVKVFAVALLVAMTALNVAGSNWWPVSRASSSSSVIGILAVFAVVTVANIEPGNLAPSTYPGVRDIVSSVALTFFAFLGFGVVTFTARDLAQPGQAAAQGDGHRDRGGDGHLRRGRARRVRYADGGRGDRRRSDGDRRRGPAGRSGTRATG